MAGSEAGRPEVLLFDLGGVLIKFQGFEALHTLLNGRLSTEEIREKWSASDLLHQFEGGRMDQETFSRAFVSEWGLDMPPDAFLDAFSRWAGPLYDTAQDLLDSVRPSFTLACLSNTNALHWRHLGAAENLDGLFDRVYLSFQLRLFKPQRDIYDHVIGDLGVPAERILFFDDAPRNVSAARDAGMMAEEVRGPEEVRRVLKQRRLIS